MKYKILILTCLIISGVGAATFYTVRWFSQQEGSRGITGFGSTMITLTKSSELPDEDPDVVGILVRRQDDNLFIGTGNVTFHSIRENDAAPMRFESGYDGPIVEIVTVRDTQIFFDVTEFDRSISSGSISQVLHPGDLDELEENHLIHAWGERHGDRVVAQTLLIFSPRGFK